MVSLPHKHELYSATHLSPHNHSNSQSHSIRWQRLFDGKTKIRQIKIFTAGIVGKTEFCFKMWGWQSTHYVGDTGGVKWLQSGYNLCRDSREYYLLR